MKTFFQGHEGVAIDQIASATQMGEPSPAENYRSAVDKEKMIAEAIEALQSNAEFLSSSLLMHAPLLNGFHAVRDPADYEFFIFDQSGEIKYRGALPCLPNSGEK